jgi:hypothetical protein
MEFSLVFSFLDCLENIRIQEEGLERGRKRSAW